MTLQQCSSADFEHTGAGFKAELNGTSIAVDLDASPTMLDIRRQRVRADAMARVLKAASPIEVANPPEARTINPTQAGHRITASLKFDIIYRSEADALLGYHALLTHRHVKSHNT